MKRTSFFFPIVGLVYRFCFFYTENMPAIQLAPSKEGASWYGQKSLRRLTSEVVLSCPWIDWKSKRLDFRNLKSMRSYLLRDVSSKLATKNSRTWGTCWWRIYNLCQLISSKRLSQGETIHMTFIQSTLSDRSGSFLVPNAHSFRGQVSKWVRQGRGGMSICNQHLSL